MCNRPKPMHPREASTVFISGKLGTNIMETLHLMMAVTFTSASPILMVCVSESAVTVEQVYSAPCSDPSLTRLKKVVFPTPSSPNRMILYSGR